MKTKLIDKFSLFGQGMLYLAKVFGIIVFFKCGCLCTQWCACSTMNVGFC